MKMIISILFLTCVFSSKAEKNKIILESGETIIECSDVHVLNKLVIYKTQFFTDTLSIDEVHSFKKSDDSKTYTRLDNEEKFDFNKQFLSGVFSIRTSNNAIIYYKQSATSFVEIFSDNKINTFKVIEEKLN
jgi:hypothetical protein